MNRLTENKIVVVTRPTRLAELVARFNTVSQARFYIEHQGADFSDYVREDETYHAALRETQAALATIARVQLVDRSFLPNFVFGPDDVVVALGQDGLVANTLKYLDGQPVVGVNPDPERWDGRLLPFRVSDLTKVMPEVLRRGRPTRSVTMAKAILNNGQTLYAVNDLFIGPKTHCSARYVIRSGEATETQSSSGVIVSTGLGASGWLKSLLTGADAIVQSVNAGRVAKSERLLPSGDKVARPHPNPLPQGEGDSFAGRAVNGVRARATGDVRVRNRCGCYEQMVAGFRWNSEYLFYTVREPFLTKTTGASLVFGQVTARAPLFLESRMAEHGVIFSDGIEKDFLEFNSGTQATIGVAERKGLLVE